nr:transmembrane protein 199 [Biomphalaria glabrata]
MADEPDKLEPVLEVTPVIRKTLEKAINSKSISSKLKNECDIVLQQDIKKALISSKTIREVYNTLRNEGHKIFLHEIVENALLIPQSVQLPPRDPELEARIQKLKVIEQNKDYERMTRNLRPKSDVLSFRQDVKTMNRQLITVFNFFLTVVAGFAFGYKCTELFYTNVLAWKMLAGLSSGLVIFFVDLYFLMRYGMKD